MGKATEDLTLYGGLTLFESRVKKATDPAQDDKRVLGTANQLVKLYAEYRLPFHRALAFTGGVYWTGDQFADSLNTDQVNGSLLGDVGARYNLRVFNRPFTFRVNVTNVGNADYWLSPYEIGLPRTVIFSMQAGLW